MDGLPSGVAKGLTEGVKKAIDYWKEYRGESVRIEYTQIEVSSEDPTEATKVTYGIEGDIKKVMTLPPGFLLDEAVHFVNPESLSLEQVPKGGTYSDQRGEMFVSFDSIETMSFPDR
ncbi:hypothetical protein [Halorubrum coriense]|uniref:hypothetical protein n=1 Tax=Halorubrum coriense TaxID=64713 RepID=UPI0012693C4A|nr:hypothetical protein [Halorubrum coriense]